MTTTRHQDDQRPAKSSPFDAKTAHKNRTVQTPMQASAQRVHAALRITTPLEACTPMMLHTLACIAHCWRDRIPANLWPDLDKYRVSTPDEFNRRHRPAKRDPGLIDIKRRAAGDND